MKTIYINCSRVPTEKAHGLQIMKMCEAFAATGKVKMELWVPSRINEIKQDPFEYYGAKRNFTIKKVPCIDFIVLDNFLGPVAFWLTELSFLFFVSFYLLASRGNIIYTRDKFPAFALALFGHNIFYEAHTIPARFFLIGRAKGVITITERLKGVFVGHGIGHDKILVAPDGVDISGFDIRETQEECRKKLALPQDKKIVLYTGHLYEWKGVDTLIKSTEYLSDGILVYIVGGNGKNVPNVIFMGHRSHKDIPYWLRAADVLILPNSAKYDISKYWTSPLKLFEYMASGRPIVASDLPSIREVLNESNAILIEPDNPKALAEAIEYIFYNNEKAEMIAARAKEEVRAYSWDKRAEQILKFIKDN